MSMLEPTGRNLTAVRHWQQRQISGLTRGDMRRAKKHAAWLAANVNREPHVPYVLPDVRVKLADNRQPFATIGTTEHAAVYPSSRGPRPGGRSGRVSKPETVPFSLRCQECSGTCDPRMHGVTSRQTVATREDPEPVTLRATGIGRAPSHREKVIARIDHAKDPQPKFFVAR